ncbi:hypothetical protein GQ55_5G453100 [Panicum hallii var. hallii]|uniref:Uncharacterized protein n=2 Tax=Panicum hallii TaxID=206008 RepID=A0A2T7DQ72_9POAL|nr:hypothetical protein PAHAL_5G448100 [Panicum hallii]PUZ57732.1 hypothetical protein GQ55_5G453100 [Panicum hallii var. hallii]
MKGAPSGSSSIACPAIFAALLIILSAAHVEPVEAGSRRVLSPPSPHPHSPIRPGKPPSAPPHLPGRSSIPPAAFNNLPLARREPVPPI